MSISIIQPDESQTFLFKYGPYGEEHQFNAKEILQKMRDYYQQNFDSIVLLPYAFEAFGYFIAGCQIGSGSDDSMYLANEDYTLGIGYNQFIAVRPLYSDTMPMCAFNTDGTLSYSFGTTSMSTYYDGAPDYYIWNYFGGNYSQPYVLYTECSCNHLYINGEEYKFGDATCKVTYFLPDDNYEYTKLTYKRDVQPESVNDGTIVNLDPSQDYVTVEGLVENASYWFKIFTSKSESEAFPYTVGESPIPPIIKYDFTKTDNIETFIVPKTGRYKLETWGAQGGNAESNGITARGGYGSYSTCEIELGNGQSIYINVGGQDGYNCGGAVSPTDDPSISNGGGATTIATVSAMMNGLSGNSSNRYKIMAMSGGGGGGMIKDNVAYDGNNGGGWKGSGNNSSNINSGYQWGYGETGYSVSAGGAGYRGGYKATSSEGGGGGCASMANFYFGTRWNNKMVGYNVPTTTGDNYTESTDKASANPESDNAKIGDGFARITYLFDLPKKSKVMPSGSTEVELAYQSLNYEWVHKTLDEILALVKNITMASGNHANAFFYNPYGYNTGGGFIMPAYVSSRNDLYVFTEETLMYEEGMAYTFSSGTRVIAVNNIDCIDQNEVDGGYILNSQKTALYRDGNHSPIVVERDGRTYQCTSGNSPLQVEENTMTYIFYTDASIANIHVDES